MPTPKLTRTKRRRPRKLADRLDLISEADRKYFERFPERRHRVRVADRVEFEEEEELVHGRVRSVPPGRQLYTAVRNVRPGLRLRIMFNGPADADPELFSEAKARAICAFHETEEHRAVEAQMIEWFEALK
jgi:hypothetical protein